MLCSPKKPSSDVEKKHFAKLKMNLSHALNIEVHASKITLLVQRYVLLNGNPKFFTGPSVAKIGQWGIMGQSQ